MSEPETPEIPVREGDVLAGKYRVERVLGVGGMGVVVAAMHTELEQRVALKFLLPTAAQNPAVVARFAREARAAAKIKSEHVARVSDVGTMDDGLPYIVMEYLEGHDLQDAIAEAGRIAPGTAVDYVLQASEALAEAHAAGFVHRDLKPGNLFLARRADGSVLVKVLDFGISKAVIGEGEPMSGKPGSLTRTSDIFGSPLYMSPEQLKASRDVDARADIWALGVILYEMLHGKTPFDRATVAETFGAILYEKPEPLDKLVPGLPAGLDAAVLRCLEKDVTTRYQHVAEMVKALLPFAEHATRNTLERTARVLKRAGVAVDTVPPPPPSVQARPVGAATNLQAGAQTRTNWAPVEPAQRPRSGARTALIALAGLAVAVSGFLLIVRLGKPRAARTGPDRAATAQTASAAPVVTPEGDKPAASAVPIASAQPTVEPSAQPSAQPSAVPVVSASAEVAPPVAPIGKAPHGKPLTGKAPPAPVATTAATVAPVVTPPPPTKPREDPDDFGPRK